VKKILIATDGSPASQEAVEFGVELAEEQDAAVVFVHVVPLVDRVPMSSFGMVGTLPHDPSERNREGLEVAEAVAERHDVRATSELLGATPSTRSSPMPTTLTSTSSSSAREAMELSPAPCSEASRAACSPSRSGRSR
jgi:nucleotide-binding universal stress UspA family protein